MDEQGDRPAAARSARSDSSVSRLDPHSPRVRNGLTHAADQLTPVMSRRLAASSSRAAKADLGDLRQPIVPETGDLLVLERALADAESGEAGGEMRGGR